MSKEIILLIIFIWFYLTWILVCGQHHYYKPVVRRRLRPRPRDAVILRGWWPVRLRSAAGSATPAGTRPPTGSAWSAFLPHSTPGSSRLRGTPPGRWPERGRVPPADWPRPTSSLLQVGRHHHCRRRGWSPGPRRAEGRCPSPRCRDVSCSDTPSNRTPVRIQRDSNNTRSMKKALRETQTLRAGWAINFRPAKDPLPGAAGRPKFNQLEMVTTFTYRPSLVKIDARNFELSW